MTSRDTRASTRSSRRAQSADSAVASCRPITDPAGTMTSSNCGTRGGSGCASTGLALSPAGLDEPDGTGVASDGVSRGAGCGSDEECAAGAPVVITVRAVRATVDSFGALGRGGGAIGADFRDGGSARRGAGAGAVSVFRAFGAAAASLFAPLTAVSVSATGCEDGWAGEGTAGDATAAVAAAGAGVATA